MPAESAHSASPFHAGEQAVQERLGVRDAIEPWARKVVRPYMPDQHRDFYGQLPFVVVAARDAHDRPWATLLSGQPGFIASPTPTSLDIAAAPLPGDALEGALHDGTDVGLLGIELDSRRRNRVNGRLSGVDDHGLRFSVGQAFGNCPQYITERFWRPAEAHEIGTAVSMSDVLTEDAQQFIRNADTFFIASGYAGEGIGTGDDRTRGMDASHRGGPRGFVDVRNERTLVFPDYAGNNHFNTIGNLVLDPRVGMTFIDFESGSLLQLTGRATIDWDSPAVSGYPGAQRLVVVDVDSVVELDRALPIRWWQPDTALRELTVVTRKRESADVVSFEFESADGQPLAPFVAGQHLPISIDLPDQDESVQRTYSLSNDPSSGRYRISVKRVPGGRVSAYLHDNLFEGDSLLAGLPAGEFVLSDSRRPVVLVSAGVGITPVLSMLYALKDSGRDVSFVHAARDGEHHALRSEVAELSTGRDHVRSLVAFSKPLETDREGIDFDVVGRMNRRTLARIPGVTESEVYLCGPAPFMAAMAGELTALGADPDRIFSETF